MEAGPGFASWKRTKSESNPSPHGMQKENQEIEEGLRKRKIQRKCKPNEARSRPSLPLLALLLLLLLPCASASDVGKPRHENMYAFTDVTSMTTWPIGPPNSFSPKALAAMATAGHLRNSTGEEYEDLQCSSLNEAARLHQLALVGLPISSLVLNVSARGTVGLPIVSSQYNRSSTGSDYLCVFCEQLFPQIVDGQNKMRFWFSGFVLLMAACMLGCGDNHEPRMRNTISRDIGRNPDKNHYKKMKKSRPIARYALHVICRECRWIGNGKGQRQRQSAARIRARERAWRLMVTRQSYRLSTRGTSNSVQKSWANKPRKRSPLTRVLAKIKERISSDHESLPELYAPQQRKPTELPQRRIYPETSEEDSCVQLALPRCSFSFFVVGFLSRIRSHLELRMRSADSSVEP